MNLMYFKIPESQGGLYTEYLGVLRYLNRFSCAFERKGGTRVYYLIPTDSVLTFLESLPEGLVRSVGYLAECSALSEYSSLPIVQYRKLAV